jgi:agmatinase
MREIGSWFGLPSVDQGRASVVVVGCPFEDAVSGRGGAAAAPDAIRSWSRSCEAVDERGRPIERLSVCDRGNARAGADRRAAILEAAGQIAPSQFLLGLGGDHAVTPALVEASLRCHGRLAFVLLDAHADLFDEYEGDRDSHACAVARVWDLGIPPERTALVGLRSYGHPELSSIRRAGLHLPAAGWSRLGAEAAADRIAAVTADAPVYVSLDIDVLDPACAPGTGYPVAGGPTTRELLDLLARLWRRVRIVGMDLVELSPALDAGEVTAAAAAQILLQVMGLVAADRIHP